MVQEGELKECFASITVYDVTTTTTKAAGGAVPAAGKSNFPSKACGAKLADDNTSAKGQLTVSASIRIWPEVQT